MMRDLYQVLGVTSDASLESIAKAYRKSALGSHPDRGGNVESMALLNEAYATLSDPVRRRNFDASWNVAKTLGSTEEEAVVVDAYIDAGGIVSFSQSFKRQHENLVSKYEQMPLTLRVITDGFQIFESNLYAIKKEATETTYFHDVFTYIHAKVDSKPLAPIEGAVTPALAIQLFTAFLSGDYNLVQVQAIINALVFMIETIKKVDTNTRELLLYESLIEILSLTSQDPEQNHRLMLSFKKIIDFAKEASDNTLSHLIPLFYNRFFRNLYAYALHLYCLSSENPLSAAQLKQFNGIEEAKALVDVLIERLSHQNQENLVELIQYVKLLHRLEKDLDFCVSSEYSAQDAREKAFLLLDWIPSIVEFANKKIIVNTFLQIGIYFQMASQKECFLSIKMADEQLALEMYRNALGVSHHATPDVENYANTLVLKYIAHFQFQDSLLNQIISAVQKRLLVIVDIFPFFEAPQSNPVFLKQENASLHLMRRLLHAMITIVEHHQALSKKIPIDQAVSNILYQAYEACLKNWYQEVYDPVTESKFRLALMESLLFDKDWTFLDIEQNIDSPWIMVDRDEDGWMTSSRALPFGEDERIVKYRAIHGAEIHYKTGEITLFIEPWEAKYSASQQRFTLYDIQEMLEKNLEAAIFSLDPVDPEKPYHPFNAMRIAPSQLCDTELLNTMLLTDYMLKFLTTAQEVQGQYPFEQRPVNRIIEHLPEYLRQIVNNFHREQHSGATHRFWIEAEEIDVSLPDEVLQKESVARIGLGNLKMIVKKHRMERDIHGELKDTEKESEGWSIFVLTNEQWLEVQQGKQVIDDSAMIFIYKEFRLFYWENNKILFVHEPENVRQILVGLYTQPRASNGKITPNSKNMSLLYRATMTMSEQTKQPHRYSPEFIFAQEFTIHYDEFSLYLPEFGRLKELSKLSVLVRLLSGLRASNKEEMKTLDFLIENKPKDNQTSADLREKYIQRQNEIYGCIKPHFESLKIQLRGVAGSEKERAHQSINQQFPNNSRGDIVDALEGKEPALQRITHSVWCDQLKAQRTLKDKVELAFANIGLAKQSEPVSLEGRCFWVPASVRHEVQTEPSGLSRHSFFVYGGVNIQPRVNIIRGAKNTPLAGSGVGDVILKNQRVYRVWGGEARSSGRSWTTVNPNQVKNYRDAAGLPNRNTGRFVSEGILKSTSGIKQRQALPFDGNRGGLPEVLVPNPDKQISLTKVSGVNPEF